MTLTLGHGPLSGDPPPANAVVDGPAHRILIGTDGVAWSSEEPLPEGLAQHDHLSFDGDGVAVEVG